ncbi:MAG: DUF4198 domain-containing protein [Verrucomicrobia bacterium]|nr:DUF4198 domain-containing protein [Verrucomicrobiota bacterium]
MTLDLVQVVYRVRLPLLGLALLCFAGCGDPGFSLVPVSGIITLNGKPLANASVVFSPASGQAGPSSVGTTDGQGQYQLTTLDQGETGAVLGSHRVTITTAKSSDPNDERAPISREFVPRRYRDGSFQMEVPPEGDEEANVDIVTK